MSRELMDPRMAEIESGAERAAKLDSLQIQLDFARADAARYRRLHQMASRALTWALVVFVPVSLSLAMWVMVLKGGR